MCLVHAAAGCDGMAAPLPWKHMHVQGQANQFPSRTWAGKARLRGG
jgi:hypothetical protein